MKPSPKQLGGLKDRLTIARLALPFVPRISRAGIIVGSALFKCFNRRSGRCDPSINRLAFLSGLPQRTVERGISDLCNSHPPIFLRIPHGGRNSTNFYKPNFGYLLDVWAEIETRMSTRSWRPMPSTSANQNAPTRQNWRNNSAATGETIPPNVADKPVEGLVEESSPSLTGGGRGCGGRGNDASHLNHRNSPKHRRASERKTVPKNRTRAEAIMEIAEKRLEQAVFASPNTEALLLVDEQVPGSWKRAIEAEAALPGSGIDLLINIGMQSMSPKGQTNETGTRCVDLPRALLFEDDDSNSDVEH